VNTVQALGRDKKWKKKKNSKTIVLAPKKEK
jgi:hypothetical protein